jgi:FkbM family methyltransferase
MDNYRAAAQFRKLMLSIVARENMSVHYDTCYGFHLLLPAWDANVVGAAAEGRMFNRQLTKILSRVIRPGDTVVDGGANVGFYSLVAANLLKGHGIVVSFEPDPRNIPFLRANAALNGFSELIRVEPRALSNAESNLDFWYSPRTSWGGSLVRMPNSSDVCMRVPASRLDVFRSSENLGRIDVIKLDLEGAEPLALQGMADALRSARLLVLEINKPRLMQLKTDPCRLIKDTLHQGCFTLMLVSDGHAVKVATPGDFHWTQVLDKLGWADVFCAKGEAAEELRRFAPEGRHARTSYLATA